MSEKTVVITEIDGSYRIRNNGISEFTLIGILECLLFDLKTARKDTLPLTKQEFPEQKEIVPEQKETVRESNQAQEPDKKQDSSNREARGKSNVPDLRTRIGNAVKAIRSLGGEVEENVDRTNATDEELQTELEELTNQYKRLKNSKGVSM